MGFISEFKEFAMKGDVLDMAVGIVIGLAFGAIITSLVKDIIMPPLGLLLGSVNFSDLYDISGWKDLRFSGSSTGCSAPTINYGLFINTIINFLIVALAIFLLIRQINAAKKKPAPPEANTKECPYCKESIAKAAVKCSHCTADLTG